MKTIWLIFKILIVSLLLVSIAITGTVIYYKTNQEQDNIETNLVSTNKQIPKTNTLVSENITRDLKVELPGENVHIIQKEEDWRTVLVNDKNPLPQNFEIELAKINGTAKEFDVRAIDELTRNDASYERCRRF